MKTSVIVLGAGRSGQAAVRLLARQGRGGWLISESTPPEEVVKAAEKMGFLWSGLLPDWTPDLAVISPGFPVEHPWLNELGRRGVERIQEFEWGARALSGTQLAITGSLGKTSTAHLARDLLAAEGHRVTLSGNVGRPVCEVALEEPEADVHVIELSSFQLEQNAAYRPDLALCLNLVPNHLDRHQNLETYAKAKAELFHHQEPHQAAMWPEGYPVEASTRAQRLRTGPDELPELKGTPFASGPFRQNLQMLTVLLREGLGVPLTKLETVVHSFQLPPHRMETLDIPDVGQVIDDSKSTCLSATRAALESVPGHVHLLMGGRSKSEDPSVLLPLFEKRNPSLYLFGESGPDLSAAWCGCLTDCRHFNRLEEAMDVVFAERQLVEPLLFSPGCASFDQYTSYEHRGRHFRKLVRELSGRGALRPTQR